MSLLVVLNLNSYLKLKKLEGFTIFLVGNNWVDSEENSTYSNRTLLSELSKNFTAVSPNEPHRSQEALTSKGNTYYVCIYDAF